MEKLPKGVSVMGPGVVYVSDYKAYLSTPRAKAQLEALKRIAERLDKEGTIHVPHA